MRYVNWSPSLLPVLSLGLENYWVFLVPTQISPLQKELLTWAAHFFAWHCRSLSITQPCLTTSTTYGQHLKLFPDWSAQDFYFLPYISEPHAFGEVPTSPRFSILSILPIPTSKAGAFCDVAWPTSEQDSCLRTGPSLSTDCFIPFALCKSKRSIPWASAHRRSLLHALQHPPYRYLLPLSHVPTVYSFLRIEMDGCGSGHLKDYLLRKGCVKQGSYLK